MFPCDCDEPIAESRTQLISNAGLEGGFWPVWVWHFHSLYSLSQQYYRDWDEGVVPCVQVEALGTLDRGLKQSLKELVGQN